MVQSETDSHTEPDGSTTEGVGEGEGEAEVAVPPLVPEAAPPPVPGYAPPAPPDATADKVENIFRWGVQRQGSGSSSQQLLQRVGTRAILTTPDFQGRS